MLHEIKNCEQCTDLIVRMLKASEQMDKRFPGSRRARFIDYQANRLGSAHDSATEDHSPSCIASWASPSEMLS